MSAFPFITIRFKQSYRELLALGPGRSIFLLLLLGIGEIFIVGASAKLPHVYYLTALYSLLPITIHFKRNDKQFLKTHIANHQAVYALEYLILGLPLLLPLLYNGYFVLCGAYLLVILLLLPIPPISQKAITYNQVLWLIPDQDFEWKSGLRKTIWLVSVVWLAGMGTSWLIGGVPLTLFILGIIVIGFYEQGEPLPMLLAFEKRPRELLVQKIKRLLILFAWLTIPLIAIFMVFHPQYWYFLVIEWLLLANLHVFTILVKYAFYRPNAKSPASQTIEAIGIFCSLMPIFVPVVWLLGIRFCGKAMNNLNAYLYDFD